MFLNFSKYDVLIILTLALPKFIVGFMTSMVIPIFPSLIRIYFNGSVEDVTINQSLVNKTLSYHYQELSILFMVKNILQIFISPFIGYLIEFLGTSPVLLCGILSHIIMILLYGLGNTYYVLIIGRIFEACASSLLLCVTFTFISIKYTNKEQQGCVFGLTALILNIGGSLGPVYSGYIYQYYGKMTVFLSILSIIILELLLSILFIYKEVISYKKAAPKVYVVEEIELKDEETKFKECSPSLISSLSSFTNSENKEKNSAINKKRKPSLDIHSKSKRSSKTSCTDICCFFKDIHFLIMLGAILTSLISLFLLFSSLPLYMSMRFNSTESQQGVVWLSTLFGYIFGFIIGHVINTCFSKYKHILFMVNTALHAAAILLIPFMTTWWSIAIPLCIIVNVQMILEVVMSPLFVIIVKERHSSMFGILSGIIMMTVSLSSSLGSYLGPVLLGTIGFMYTSIGLCLVNVIFLPLYLCLRSYSK